MKRFLLGGILYMALASSAWAGQCVQLRCLYFNVCMDSGMTHLTCQTVAPEFRADSVCTKPYGHCIRLASGQCGWQQNKNFLNCIYAQRAARAKAAANAGRQNPPKQVTP
jgi:hypothetical protein